ncbi:MAG: hypothetical protein IT245_02045 [Bacteroidia bacterium]|nr:hypothetical protein [Bacteroidia bacterium]
MKVLLLALSMFALGITAEDRIEFQCVQVLDVNSEALSGVKIQLDGTNKSFYTNSKGYCYIPVEFLKSSRIVTVDCISYKSKNLYTFELNSKIVLDFR